MKITSAIFLWGPFRLGHYYIIVCFPRISLISFFCLWPGLGIALAHSDNTPTTHLSDISAEAECIRPQFSVQPVSLTGKHHENVSLTLMTQFTSFTVL